MRAGDTLRFSPVAFDVAWPIDENPSGGMQRPVRLLVGERSLRLCRLDPLLAMVLCSSARVSYMYLLPRGVSLVARCC